ncbi:hypothetical protein PoB_004290700 [Plakobranchus ocellatus]|uniref:Uncharacterized protein n=1 Tax=Plakobranchus ocellatus TaxID=259542 RepID=A0AAV4BAE0_9GAST|nr:hypothetical protein PoB_004290700 [Plakobranchus ocellatus]
MKERCKTTSRSWLRRISFAQHSTSLKRLLNIPTEDGPRPEIPVKPLWTQRENGRNGDKIKGADNEATNHLKKCPRDEDILQGCSQDQVGNTTSILQCIPRTPHFGQRGEQSLISRLRASSENTCTPSSKLDRHPSASADKGLNQLNTSHRLAQTQDWRDSHLPVWTRVSIS